ncbi:unnamed protein product [Discula destructiva]
MSPRNSDEERVAFLSHSSSRTSDAELDDFLLDKTSPHKTPHPLQSRLRTWLCSRPRVLRRNVFRHPLLVVVVACKYILLLLVVILVATPLLIPSYTRLPPHYRALRDRCEGPDAQPGCANPHNEKVFISVSLYDKGGHLANGRWGEQILELIQMIGPDNTFLSIYENDSPLGKAPLEALAQKVPCAHHIVYDDAVSLDGFGNVTLSDGSVRMKRLSYLSEMRNRALRPLDRFDDEAHGGNGTISTTTKTTTAFDKVLFLNDVLFRTTDAAQLLFSTNAGDDGRAHYLSACALDYDSPVKFYDLYATRDAEGFSNGVPIFPIFTSAGEGLSRKDMLAQKDAVRVSGCWSGMVAMQAGYVQNRAPELPYPGFDAIGAHVIEPDNPHAVEAPVRFRYEPEAYVDACECCLFLADVSAAAARTATAEDKELELGVFMNPYVRVAYDDFVLRWLHRLKRWERLFVIPHDVVSSLSGLPRNNPLRAVREGEPFVEEVWDTQENAWALVNRTGRSGLFCAVREMQLIVEAERTGDKNWKNYPMPEGQTLWFPT